jgi:excisionase family DNA binding protein
MGESLGISSALKVAPRIVCHQMYLADQLEQRQEALTAEEVAAVLACSVKMIYKMVRQGSIPHFRVGLLVRFDGQALSDWLRQRSLVTRMRH